MTLLIFFHKYLMFNFSPHMCSETCYNTCAVSICILKIQFDFKASCTERISPLASLTGLQGLGLFSEHRCNSQSSFQI